MSYFIIFFLLGVLVFVHELGHFTMAKLLKIPVERFSIGFGYKLWSYKKNETEYTISVIPFGGYVLPMLDNEQEFYKIKWIKRVLFVLGGPSANIISAFSCLIILNIFSSDVSFNSILIKPFMQTFNYMHQIIIAIPSLFTKHNELSGIIGIVVQGGKFIEMDLIKLLNFTIFLNLNLAILNLLPFLPLDGGNLVLYILEKINPKILKLHLPLAITGWILLVGLMLYSTVLDIGRYSAGLI